VLWDVLLEMNKHLTVVPVVSSALEGVKLMGYVRVYKYCNKESTILKPLLVWILFLSALDYFLLLELSRRVRHR